MNKFAITILGAIAVLGIASAQTPAATPKTAAKPAAATTTAKPAAAKLMDINSASVAELKTLPGITDEYAQKIVSGRPYKGRNELADRKILPNDVYSKIRLSVRARQPKTASNPPSATSSGKTPAVAAKPAAPATK